MASVIIAAHNEASVIGRCLSALRAEDPDLEVVVAANGCTDDTADVARQHGARVVELVSPGKALALNAGDDLATSFPRFYLDADIAVNPGTIDGLSASLSVPGVLAAGPRRRMDASQSALGVRAYYAVNNLLPAFREGLFGRGLIAVSEAGRARFGTFPLMVADDLFLDSVFAANEKVNSPVVEVVVDAPRDTRALVRRLVRVRQGNAAMRAAAGTDGVPGAVRTSDPLAWLRVIVPRRLHLLPAGVLYAGITVFVALSARWKRSGVEHWGRDDSTRQARSEG